MINSKYPLVPLSDIAIIYNGNSINKRIKQEKYTGLDQGRNFVATKDIDFDGTVNYENGVKIPFDESSFKTAPSDCVFVCSEGGSAGKKTAYITQQVCFGNKLYAIVGKDDNFVGKYVYYFTRYSGFSSQFKDLLNGIIGGVSLKKFGSILIPYPSKETQESIVEKIENQFSQLDSAVETLNKTKQQLEVYRQAVLKEAFSGNLTKKWRDDNKEEWSIVNILSLVKHEKNALKAGPFGSALKKSFYVSVGYKVYGQEQVIAGDESIGDYFINELKYKELYNCRVKPHDVLISLVGTVGKVLILSDNCKEGIINPRLIKVSLDENVYLPKFFKYYFESSYLKSLYKLKTHGATMDVLNMGMIKELPFPLCSIDEQKQIIKEIETRYSLCDNIEQTVNQSLQQAEVLRQSILKQAFEGML